MLLLLMPPANADSFDYQTHTAVLLSETVLYVEIVRADELINWFGAHEVELLSPGGDTFLLESGGSHFADEAGTWTVTLDNDEESWDINVSATADGNGSGRVYSTHWHIDSGSEPINDRFYVPVPLIGSEDPLEDPSEIFKIYTEGLIGDHIEVAASLTGLSESPGYSNPDGTFGDALPVFLERPEFLDSSGYTTPIVDNEEAHYDLDCEQVVPGYGGVTVTFETTGHGQPALICDLNEDNTFDVAGVDDLALYGPAGIGNEIDWSGFNHLDEPAEPGEMTCSLRLHSSPMHALVSGAEVASPGVRLFTSVDASYSPGRLMWWNDTVIGTTTNTEDGSQPLTATRIAGINGGDVYSNGITCTQYSGTDCTAHGWGALSTPDELMADAWVDTWTYDDEYVASDSFPVTVADPEADEDGDTLPSAIEECLIGTDPLEADSDDDHLPDNEEVGDDWENPLNFDGDDDINALDPDDDNDGIPTETEWEETAEAGLSEDVDGDQDPNWYDEDADDDGIEDGDEPGDANENDIPDYLEAAGTSPSDSGEPEPPGGTDTGGVPGLTGDFQGGVCHCASTTGSAVGMLPALLVMLAARRRREQ